MINIETAIEVQDWGDFDVLRTRCIMVADFKTDVKSVVDEYCAYRGLSGTDGLSYKQLDGRTEDFIKFLKRKGFKELKTKPVCFSD